jgi:hypothetical protein
VLWRLIPIGDCRGLVRMLIFSPDVGVVQARPASVHAHSAGFVRYQSSAMLIASAGFEGP